MLQATLPPSIPLDPNNILGLIGALAALAVGVIGLKWLFHSPIGEAIGEGIRARRRRRWGEATGEVGAPDVHRVSALEEQVAQLQGQVAELAERLDFAERVLAERRPRKLGAGP